MPPRREGVHITLSTFCTEDPGTAPEVYTCNRQLALVFFFLKPEDLSLKLLDSAYLEN